MKKSLGFVAFILLLAISAIAQEFPGPFVSNGAPVSNLVIVVVDTAPASDVIAAVKIARAFYPEVSQTSPAPLPEGLSRLSSEIDDISRYNSIVIGSSCYNPITAQLLGNPEPCGQSSGLRWIRHQNGNVALLITGLTDAEVRANAESWIAGAMITCIDSDGGLSYDVQGTTKVGSQSITDYCNHGGIVRECSGPDCYLNEHYCASSSQIGQKSDIVCPNGCREGVCVGEPVLQPPSFSLKVGDTFIIVAKGKEYSMRLIEIFGGFPGESAEFDVNGEIFRLSPGDKYVLADGTAFVLNKFSAGRFAEIYMEGFTSVYLYPGEPGECTDSDQGREPRERGKTCAGGDCREDFCDGNILHEFYCSSGKIIDSPGECQGVCREGACRATAEPAETYETCVAAYQEKARMLEIRHEIEEARRANEEGYRVCGERFGRLIPPTTVEESPEFKACINRIEKSEIRQTMLEYEKAGKPFPEELKEKFQEMHDECLRLAGWTLPGVVGITHEKERMPRELCLGCARNSHCLQFGIRLVDENGQPVYCDIDKTFKPQKDLGEPCQNNYECLSNSCSQKCISVEERIEAVERELKEQRSLIEKILDFFKKLFGG